MQQFTPKDFHTSKAHCRKCDRVTGTVRAWFVSQNNQQETIDDIWNVYDGDYELMVENGKIIMHTPDENGRGYRRLWAAAAPSVIALESDGKLWKWPLAMFMAFHELAEFQDVNGNR